MASNDSLLSFILKDTIPLGQKSPYDELTDNIALIMAWAEKYRDDDKPLLAGGHSLVKCWGSAVYFKMAPLTFSNRNTTGNYLHPLAMNKQVKMSSQASAYQYFQQIGTYNFFFILQQTHGPRKQLEFTQMQNVKCVIIPLYYQLKLRKTSS